MKRATLLLFTYLFYNFTIYSETKEQTDSYQLEASYVGDLVGNMSGGIKQGGTFLGMANITLGVYTEGIGWWKNGEFFINGASIHGASPTENLVGDFQVISNIDAGEHTYIHELWYKHSFKKVNIIAGLQDLNENYAASETADEYINSSFGIPPVIAENVPVPIFPLTGLGLSVEWEVTSKINWLNAVFDGCPSDFSENKYNLKWDLNKDDGFLIISELQFNAMEDALSTYRLGYYYHTGLSELDEDTETMSEVFSRNYGIYLIIDQNLWSKGKKTIDLFAQIAVSPYNDVNQHNHYVGAGLNFTGFFSKKRDDILGIAFADAGFHYGMHKHETVIEAFYKVMINENIYIQPDIQYVINPSGSETERRKNATVGFLRFGINF